MPDTCPPPHSGQIFLNPPNIFLSWCCSRVPKTSLYLIITQQLELKQLSRKKRHIFVIFVTKNFYLSHFFNEPIKDTTMMWNLTLTRPRYYTYVFIFYKGPFCLTLCLVVFTKSFQVETLSKSDFQNWTTHLPSQKTWNCPPPCCLIVIWLF